ncbi:hypothetical protein SCOR_32775 [Sulfidibacter corallicola]
MSLQNSMLILALEDDRLYAPSNVAKLGIDQKANKDLYDAARKSLGEWSRYHNIRKTFDNRDEVGRQEGRFPQWLGKTWKNHLTVEQQEKASGVIALAQKIAQSRDPLLWYPVALTVLEGTSTSAALFNAGNSSPFTDSSEDSSEAGRGLNPANDSSASSISPHRSESFDDPIKDYSVFLLFLKRLVSFKSRLGLMTVLTLALASSLILQKKPNNDSVADYGKLLRKSHFLKIFQIKICTLAFSFISPLQVINSLFQLINL